MNIEKYTDRAKGFLQAAQTIALREGHQQFTPGASAQGAARRQRGHGGGADRPLRRPVEARLAADRRGARQAAQGSAAAAPAACNLTPGLARVFDTAEKAADKAGDSFVTVERLLLALAIEKETEAGKALAKAGVTPQGLNAAIEAIRKGRTADSASAEQAYDALKKYARDLTAAAREGKLDPVIGRDEEIRRTIQVLSPPHQEQSRADRRARRRQDRDRRGPGAAHRQWRRAREPQGQGAARARHGLADRRREISRRVRGAAEGGAERGLGGRGRRHPVHRRDAHPGRRRQGRWRDGCLEPAEAGAGARRAALRRRDHARRVPQICREGRGAGAALPARLRRRAERSRTRSRSCAA